MENGTDQRNMDVVSSSGFEPYGRELWPEGRTRDATFFSGKPKNSCLAAAHTMYAADTSVAQPAAPSAVSLRRVRVHDFDRRPGLESAVSERRFVSRLERNGGEAIYIRWCAGGVPRGARRVRLYVKFVLNCFVYFENKYKIRLYENITFELTIISYYDRMIIFHVVVQFFTLCWLSIHVHVQTTG